MILRNAAVRHSRRTLASSAPRCSIRHVSTSTNPTAEATNPASSSTPDWPIAQPRRARPKVVSNQKKKQKLLDQYILTLGADTGNTHKGSSWTKPHKIGSKGVTLSPAEQFSEFERIQKNTRSTGSVVEHRYSPTDMIANPPRARDVTLELLMASQTHMGHNTSLWNPANSRYIFGVREGIHIISLEVTAAHLRRAARVVEDVAYRGGIILFVGTRRGQMDIVTKAAEMAGGCHVFTKWLPGTITNKEVILETREPKVVDHKDKQLPDFDHFSSTAVPLMPDLVVCLNPMENHTLLYECGLKNIPTIGVIDTNADPTWVTYTIPANDDSLRSVGVIGSVLGRAGQTGTRHRLEEADKGTVTWSTPPPVQKHMKNGIRRAVNKRKELMGAVQHNNVEDFNEEEQTILRSRFAEAGLPTVGEDEMVQMMGQAAVGEARGEKKAEAVIVEGKTADQ